MENNNSNNVSSLVRATINTAAIEKPKTTRQGAGRKKATLADHFAGMSMGAFVADVWMIGKTALEHAAIAASRGKVPVSGDLTDGSYVVTRAGMVTLESGNRSFIANVEHVLANVEDIITAVKPGVSLGKVSAADDAIDPLAYLDNLVNAGEHGESDDSGQDDDGSLPEDGQ